MLRMIIIVGCANQGLWERMCHGIGRTDFLEDPRFTTGQHDPSAQLLDFKCVEFVEELMYGEFRKTPLRR